MTNKPPMVELSVTDGHKLPNLGQMPFHKFFDREWLLGLL
jgi:hypothetical protein